MSNLFDTVIDDTGADRPAFRQAPPGEYTVIVKGCKEVKASKGTRGIELSFTLLEYHDSGDMEGVDLSKVGSAIPSGLPTTRSITSRSVSIASLRTPRAILSAKLWTFCPATR